MTFINNYIIECMSKIIFSSYFLSTAEGFFRAQVTAQNGLANMSVEPSRLLAPTVNLIGDVEHLSHLPAGGRERAAVHRQPVGVGVHVVERADPASRSRRA